VFAFEKRLAEASLDNVALRDPKLQDHTTTFAELQKMAPASTGRVLRCRQTAARRRSTSRSRSSCSRSTTRLASTPIDQWRTYLRWHVLHASTDALPQPFVEENFAFYGKYLSGATEMKPRWKRCAEDTDNLLGDALGHAYVEKYFPPEAKARMQDMVKNILLAMHDTIEGLDWMTPETKAKALEKLATFNPKIGYPDKWKTYDGVRVARSSYWDDREAAARWNCRRRPAPDRQAGRPLPAGA
jgi:endothelin-converting enzyme/putative endopeptidase